MILKSENKNVIKIKDLLDTTILLISILDINEIIVSNKVSFNRKVLIILFVTKMLK